MKMTRVGLYFGSFNPVHTGHLIIAESMKRLNVIDQIWMVVSPLNPFKKKDGLLDHNIRLTLIEKATKGNEFVRGSDVEFDLPIPSYTIDTLDVLTAKNPKTRFSLIMGEDNLEHLDKWKKSQELIDRFVIYVYPRLNHFTDKFESEKNIIKIDAPIIELSSTAIRKAIKSGESIRYITADIVKEEIERNNYYK